MRHAWTFCLLIGSLLLGCNSRPSRVKPVSIDPSSASSAAIELYDKDGDGLLAGEELSAVPGIKRHLKNYDKDSDGKVSPDEIAARFEDWSNQKNALSGPSMGILLDGQPLGGATVLLEPEPYLGPNVKPASGITAENGFVMLSHGPDDSPKTSTGRPIPGVFSGTFKVKITHPSRQIPAKYNTATILGEEVAYDIDDSNPTVISLTNK